MIKKVRRRIDPLLQLGLLHLYCLRQQAPEEAVHNLRQRGNVNLRSGAGQFLKQSENIFNPGSSPGMNLSLFPREIRIRERGLLPRPVRSQVFQIVGKGASEQIAQPGPNIVRSPGTKIEAAELL